MGLLIFYVVLGAINIFGLEQSHKQGESNYWALVSLIMCVIFFWENLDKLMGI